MAEIPPKNPDREAELDAVIASYLQHSDKDPDFDRHEFLQVHAQFSAELKELIDTENMIENMAGPRIDQATEENVEPTPRFVDQPTIIRNRLQAEAAANSSIESDRQSSEDPSIREFGDYILLEQIGRGGMGVVYLAQQKSLDRLVAVKMIRRSGETTDDDIRRFISEAQAAARLQHPHIVDVFEIGEMDGEYFFSMEFVTGKDLSRRELQETLNTRKIAEHVKTVAWAIEHAHRNQIVHRDLKPANIIIDEYDQPRVTDFGLAKDTRRTQQLAQEGASIGTPAYMSPEQVTADDDRVGPASDIYSLGAVLYSLLAKRPPFRSRSALATLRQVIRENPILPSDLDPTIDRRLEAICMKCLKKVPEERYTTAAALADDLDRYLRDQPIEAVPSNPVTKMGYWLRDVPLIAAISGRSVQSASLGQRLFQLFVPIAILLSIFILRTQGCSRTLTTNPPTSIESSRITAP